jgi:Rrf2 family protein
MTLLSRKADYALLILSYLFRRPEGGNARAIAERFGLSRAFVANILKELCHNGYVTSHRGVKGGYVLHASAADVTLAELLESIDEQFRLTMCSPASPTDDVCSFEHDCPVKGPLADIHRRIVDVLHGVTLSQLLAGEPTLPGLPLLPLLQREAPCCSTAGCHSESTNA